MLIRPCQIGILLSVRVRVGFRVLNPIKNKFVGDNFLNNSDVPGFRNKYYYTIIKTINIHVLPNTYLCEYLLGWTCWHYMYLRLLLFCNKVLRSILSHMCHLYTGKFYYDSITSIIKFMSWHMVHATIIIIHDCITCTVHIHG